MATATIIQASRCIPYTPSGAKSKGDVIVTVSRVGIAMRDIAANVAGELCIEGTALFPKSTAGSSAIPDATRVFWNAGSGIISITSTDGLYLGTTVGASVDADSTQQVALNAASAASPAQAAVVAALTDNSGGASADGTIGAVTAPTALTDNGGGTADATVASMAAPTTLTDSTSFSGTHDDTLASAAAPVTLTDSTGLSGSHNDTLEAVTTFTPSVAWNGSSVYPSAADATAIAAAITALNQNASDTAQKVIELVTLAGVLGQNDSDIAQKIIEIVTWQGTVQNNFKELTTAQAANRTAIVALTDAVKELATKVNEVIAGQKTAGQMLSA